MGFLEDNAQGIKKRPRRLDHQQILLGGFDLPFQR